MYRFYCSPQNIYGDKIIITDKGEIHHIKDVLRLKLEDEIKVFDDRGNEYNCLIKKVSHNIVLGIKDKHISSDAQQNIRISVACAIPKKSKMDEIVDKLTQLGVDRIIPLSTQRVIIKLDKHKEKLRLARWQKIALAAAKQSGRNRIPIIGPVKNIKEVLLEARDGFEGKVYDLKLILTLTGSKRKSLREIFCGYRAKNLLVLIGPEGDFTPEEVDLAKKSGCISVSLGDLVLRVETAAVSVVSILNYVLKYPPNPSTS